jgi:hypothetical protein
LESFYLYFIETSYCQYYSLVFAVPNGGHRHGSVAAQLSYEGLKKGIQDIMIMNPRGKYHGMMLEVKTESGTVQPLQRAAKANFSEQGYYCVIKKGYEECKDALIAYFLLPDFDNKAEISDS